MVSVRKKLKVSKHIIDLVDSLEEGYYIAGVILYQNHRSCKTKPITMH